MLMRFLISFLVTACLLISCQNSASSEATGSEGKQESNPETVADETDREMVEWQPKKRSYSAQNELEGEIIGLQDSVDKAGFEDRLDMEVMEMLISKMKAHGLKYRDHPRSSAYLLQAGDYAQGTRDFDEAIEILGIILEEYPDSYEYIDALYYTGYIYDRQKKDYDNAVKYYERFIRELPTDDLAAQVQAHLNRVQTIIKNEKNSQ